MTISAPTIDTAHPATVQATTPAITAATTSGMEQQAAQWGTHLASHPVGGWLGGTLLAMLLALAALGLRRAARRPSSPSPGPRLRDEKGVAAMALGLCTLTLALAGAAATVFTTLAASGRAGGPWARLTTPLRRALAHMPTLRFCSFLRQSRMWATARCWPC